MNASVDRNNAQDGANEETKTIGAANWEGLVEETEGRSGLSSTS